MTPEEAARQLEEDIRRSAAESVIGSGVTGVESIRAALERELRLRLEALHHREETIEQVLESLVVELDQGHYEAVWEWPDFDPVYYDKGKPPV